MAWGQSFHRENTGPIYRDEAECTAGRIFWGELLLRFRMAGNKSNKIECQALTYTLCQALGEIWV